MKNKLSVIIQELREATHDMANLENQSIATIQENFHQKITLKIMSILAVSQDFEYDLSKNQAVR